MSPCPGHLAQVARRIDQWRGGPSVQRIHHLRANPGVLDTLAPFPDPCEVAGKLQDHAGLCRHDLRLPVPQVVGRIDLPAPAVLRIGDDETGRGTPVVEFHAEQNGIGQVEGGINDKDGQPGAR